MQIKNSSGLCFNFLENGSVKNIEVNPIRISLKSTSLFAKGGTNIFIRKRNHPYTFTPLIGTESNSQFGIAGNTFIVQGYWEHIHYVCKLSLSGESATWQWGIQLTNNSELPVELDLIYMQDVGLKPISDNLVNEYYVSQYIERIILDHSVFGSVICCRQNMKESIGNPWLMIAGSNGMISASTDGMQLWGNTSRETGMPQGLLEDILGGNCAGESPIVALQEKPFVLQPAQTHKSFFIGTYLPDHPQATSESDLYVLTNIFSEFSAQSEFNQTIALQNPQKNLFNTSAFLPVADLTSEEINLLFGNEKRHEEFVNDKLLSFFYKQNNHVVLRSKELSVDRPHGHIIQAKTALVPDENTVSTTCFAFGVFNSHLTQGNTNFNVLLSVCTNQFNLSLESGQRIFVEIDDKYYLLGVPSAFEMGLNHCRWIYKHENYVFQVRTWSSKTQHRVNLDFRVLQGNSVNILITHDFDMLNSWQITQGNRKGEFLALPQVDSMIAAKFPKAQYRIIVNSDDAHYETNGAQMLYSTENIPHSNSMFVIKATEIASFCMSFVGEVCGFTEVGKIYNTDIQYVDDCIEAQKFWEALSLNLIINGNQKDIAAIREILPWYGMNALTHFLTPYGLEQFSGAAWGTRDVSQGPIDMLLTFGKYEEAKQVLCIIFSNQNPDGGWAQWWMFDSYFEIRAGDSHGDIFYWVIIALSDYIKATGDFTILEEVLPYYHKNGVEYAEKQTIREHIDRLIAMITASFIPNTALVPFGGGDWNDSLQPVNKELASCMVSSWTVEMNYQAFMQYKGVIEQLDSAKANELGVICENIKSDFNKYLVKDGIVAGYGLLEADKTFNVLLHPEDTKTGIKYSILPMNRGIISEIFTPEQAVFHQELIEKHLKGPDGARLMDCPLTYKGGIQEIFQRAESSTFFGREIGLMYIHEHIRYAESQARMGNAQAFVKALRQAIPVHYSHIVPCGDMRQSNCYYSSSDVVFKSRYEADQIYDEVIKGNVKLKGGWRVYSSGPGIYISMIVSRLFGLRKESNKIIIDPVMPKSMNGLQAEMNFLNRQIVIRYIIEENSFSPKTILINEKDIAFTHQVNKYRAGGALISENSFLSCLDRDINLIVVYL